MADPLSAALIVATVGAELGKANSQMNAADSKESALNMQAKELELQTQQKTINNYNVMEKALEAQIAHMTTTGAAFSSPSFNAIQRNTLNIGAKNQKNIDMEYSIADRNIMIEKRNVKNSLYAQLFGDLAESASMGINMYNATPKKGL